MGGRGLTRRAALAAVVTWSCGGAEAPPRPPPALVVPPLDAGAQPGRTLDTLGTPGAAAVAAPLPPGPKQDGHACFTTAVPIGLDLVVSPPDVSPLDLRVHGVAMRARIEPGELVELTLTGPVTLTGAVQLDPSNNLAPAWMTSRGGTFAEGLLVSKGERAVDLASTAGSTAEVSFSFLGTERVAGARVACSDLALGHARGSGETPVLAPGAKAFFARGEAVRVCTDASASHCVMVSKGVPLEEVSRRGDLVTVRARASEGEIHGLARAADLAPGRVPAGLGTLGIGSGCGCGSSGSWQSSRDPREVHGAVRLAPGTRIYATRELLGPWATVREEVEAEVDMAASDEFGAVRHLPGISTTRGCDCSGIQGRAFVPRAGVLLP